MKKHLTLCLAFAVALVLAVTPAAKADHVFLIFMDGTQEAPPPPMISGGYGFGVAIMSDDATRVDWALVYDGLEGSMVSGAHFHIAPPGVAGPVVRGYPTSMFSLPGSGGVAVIGEWTSTDREPFNDRAISAFFDGNIYFNIHTTPGWAGGEIRGQAFYLFSY